MNDVDVEGRTIKAPPISIKLLEADEDKPIPQGMKRVDVHVFWRWEDNKTFDVPKDMDLSDVRDNIVFEQDEYFDFNYCAWLTEFEVWNIQTQEGDEEWWI